MLLLLPLFLFLLLMSLPFLVVVDAIPAVGVGADIIVRSVVVGAAVGDVAVGDVAVGVAVGDFSVGDVAVGHVAVGDVVVVGVAVGDVAVGDVAIVFLKPYFVPTILYMVTLPQQKYSLHINKRCTQNITRYTDVFKYSWTVPKQKLKQSFSE